MRRFDLQDDPERKGREKELGGFLSHFGPKRVLPIAREGERPNEVVEQQWKEANERKDFRGLRASFLLANKTHEQKEKDRNAHKG